MSGKGDTVDRDPDTEAVIRQALRAAEAAKALKKGHGLQLSGKKRGALSLEELEDLEGGPVRESKVGMAVVKRAEKRKAKNKLAEADIVPVHQVERVEEGAEEVVGDEGTPLEPFNLKAERAAGHFDESGHYVESKQQDAEEADAWLASAEASVVSEAVRRRIEEQRRREAEAEAAPELSGAQLAQLKRTISDLLQPGETVTRALNRLGGGGIPAAGKHKRGVKGTGAKPSKLTPDQKLSKEQFDALTEAASNLMDSGELDVYSETRETFERAASLYAPAVAAAAVDDGDDMFADPEAETSPSKATLVSPAPHQRASAAAEPVEQAGPQADRADGEPILELQGHVVGGTTVVASAGAEPEVDYASWPIKELRRFLLEHDEDPSNIVEKGELVEKVKALALAGPAGEVAGRVPAGYVFDPSSGYHLNADANMYYDATTGGYYSGSDGKWYSYDNVGQRFVEWTGS